MAGPKAREGAACALCKSRNTVAWSTNRRRCNDCNRTYSIIPLIRPHKPRLTEKCHKCGCTEVVRSGSQQVRCTGCGSTWYEGRNRKPDATVQKSVIVVTSAVNDTPVHRPFLASLERYVADRDGQLVVIPIRYKNPTSRTENQDYTWSPCLHPYLTDKRIEVCRGLQIMADIKTQPTAVSPLSRMKTITGSSCGVFGHTKIALESVPTRGTQLPKLLLTTGAVTRPLYSDTTAGKMGEFHHSLGAVVIEVDGDTFHLRHLCGTSDGSFIDLDLRWTKDGAKPAGNALALVMGDVHAERADEGALKATVEMLDVLKPRKLVMHDVLDFGSASHHNSVWERFARRLRGADKVADELRTTARLIDAFHRKGQETVIVSSNHHDHLAKWLADSRNGDDLTNASLYHAAKASVLGAIERAGVVPNIFALVMRPLLKHPATFLGDHDSMTVAGIELAYHGDKGPNGARGSADAFDRIGAKTIIGHSHSPRIVGGCYQTGTSSLLNMGYNVGPSSWLHSHVVVYANGKRSHIHIVQGEWHGRRKGAKGRGRKSGTRAGRAGEGDPVAA